MVAVWHDGTATEYAAQRWSSENVAARSLVIPAMCCKSSSAALRERVRQLTPTCEMFAPRLAFSSWIERIGATPVDGFGTQLPVSDVSYEGKTQGVSGLGGGWLLGTYPSLTGSAHRSTVTSAFSVSGSLMRSPIALLGPAPRITERGSSLGQSGLDVLLPRHTAYDPKL